MMTEQELRQKLRKIAALFEVATSAGERDAAAAALNRIRTALSVAEKTEQAVEMTFRLPDRWSRQLFLCGGVRGYADLLDILLDPEHEEFEQMSTWVGPRFNAEVFSAVAVNQHLQKRKSA